MVILFDMIEYFVGFGVLVGRNDWFKDVVSVSFIVLLGILFVSAAAVRQTTTRWPFGECDGYLFFFQTLYTNMIIRLIEKILARIMKILVSCSPDVHPLVDFKVKDHIYYTKKPVYSTIDLWVWE